MTYDMEVSYMLFGKMSVKVFGPYFNCVVYFLIVEFQEFFLYFE